MRTGQGAEVVYGPAEQVAYSLNHGTSPEAEATRILQRFMCCEAGRNQVEYGLLRPFGYSLEPGKVAAALRHLIDFYERDEAEVAGIAHQLRDGELTAEVAADRLADLGALMRRTRAERGPESVELEPMP